VSNTAHRLAHRQLVSPNTTIRGRVTGYSDPNEILG
jgi:hypothetical protein